MTLLAAGDGPSAGPLGVLVIVLIGLATVLLIKNMNARLKRLPRSFEDRPTPHQKSDDGSASGPTADS